MNPSEVAVHEVQSHSIAMIIKLLRESVCEPRKAPHVHSHGQVLPFNVVGADVCWIGIAAHLFHLATDANRWRVSSFVFEGSTVNFVKLGVIHIRSKSIFNRFQICFVAIRRDLHAILDSTGTILHEVFCPIPSTPANAEADNQLRLDVDSNPSPHIAPTNFLVCSAHVLGLSPHVSPNPVTLQTAY